MKYLSILLFFLLSLNAAVAQTENQNENYDSTLAVQYGADDYGMKSYIFVMLKSGPLKSDDKAFNDSCFVGHMANINLLVEQGKMIIAGPMGPNDNTYRGIFILDVKTKEEALELLKGDPAISSGLLAADLYEWYGSAALPAYLEDSDKIWKTNP
ncbi:MAG: YciI family protein [Crocinitomicaceae bacterium]